MSLSRQECRSLLSRLVAGLHLFLLANYTRSIKEMLYKKRMERELLRAKGLLKEAEKPPEEVGRPAVRRRARVLEAAAAAAWSWKGMAARTGRAWGICRAELAGGQPGGSATRESTARSAGVGGLGPPTAIRGCAAERRPGGGTATARGLGQGPGAAATKRRLHLTANVIIV